jgi:lysophospholipase L1-like esterase
LIRVSTLSHLRTARDLLHAVVFGTAVAAAGCGSPSGPNTLPGPEITCPPAPPAVQSNSGQPVSISYGVANSVGGTPPVAIACTPSSGSLFPVGTTTVTCLAKDSLQRTSICTFAVTITTPPRLSVTRFAAFGDSITWGEDGTNSFLWQGFQSYPRVQLPAAETYPGALQAQLIARYVAQTPTVTNLGQPGEAVTIDGVSRFQTVIVSSSYDVVLLMEGSNDLSEGQSIEPSVIAGLRQMIDTARGRGIRPFLATIPPMNPDGFRGRSAPLVPGFDDQVRSLATSQNVPLVDIYAALNTDIATYIGADGLHPTSAGFAKMADTFFASIKSNLEISAGTASISVRPPDSNGVVQRSGSPAPRRSTLRR